jgi:2-C-methyl-D-erythritol 4-phosphate cytidylyltransferase
MEKRAVLVVLTMVLMASSLLFAQKDKTQLFKVYVFTAEAKYVDADSKARADSVKDLLRFIENKKKTMVLVEDRKSAEMTLEVLGRDLVATGSMTTAWDPVLGDTKTTQNVAGTLWVKMTVGDYSTKIVGRGGAFAGAWSVAADDISAKVDRWIKDNGAKVDRK